MWPQVLVADSAQAAFAAYAARFEEARRATKNAKGTLALEPLPSVQSIAFDAHIHAGVAADLSTRRQDRLIRRKNWQFGDRDEFLAFLPTSSSPSQKV